MPKALDLTNQKFGKLTALRRAPKQNDKYTRWICQCDCGNLTIVRTDFLRNGHTSSCGCEKNKHFQRYDLVGQVFGYLTVLASAPPDSQKCQCKCGSNPIIVKTANLMNGNTQSCGCYQKEQTSKASFKSLIGKKFGKLLVVERVENNFRGEVCYKCQCDCGGVTIVTANNLRGKNTNSCGCLKSKGEMLINQWLQENKICFQPQYSLNEIILDSGRRPFFDFAIFNQNNKLLGLIEYNGKQHYEVTGGWNTKETFNTTQYRDRQKMEQCMKLNIPLYIISYQDNLEKKLQDIKNELFVSEAEELLREEDVVE